jgi:hypothetical protein
MMMDTTGGGWVQSRTTLAGFEVACREILGRKVPFKIQEALGEVILTVDSDCPVPEPIREKLQRELPVFIRLRVFYGYLTTGPYRVIVSTN